MLSKSIPPLWVHKACVQVNVRTYVGSYWDVCTYCNFVWVNVSDYVFYLTQAPTGSDIPQSQSELTEIRKSSRVIYNTSFGYRQKYHQFKYDIVSSKALIVQVRSPCQLDYVRPLSIQQSWRLSLMHGILILFEPNLIDKCTVIISIKQQSG